MKARAAERCDSAGWNCGARQNSADGIAFHSMEFCITIICKNRSITLQKLRNRGKVVQDDEARRTRRAADLLKKTGRTPKNLKFILDRTA